MGRTIMNRKLFMMAGTILAAGTLLAKEVIDKPVTASELSLEQRVASLEENKADKSELLNGIEMHGYMRSGLLLNAKNNLKKVDTFNKYLVGRLGNENDTYGEIGLTKTWNLKNGAWTKFHVMLANGNDYFYDNDDHAGVENHSLDLRQLYIEGGNISGFTGNFKNSTLWVGKRYYDRRNIGITDFYYTDFSGIGAGINNIKFAKGTLDFAIIGNESDVEDSDNIIGALIRFTEKEWSFFVAGNKSKGRDTRPYPDSSKNLRLAETGFQLGAEYTHPNFYWLAEGYSKYYAMVGTGLSSGTGLGRMRPIEKWVDSLAKPYEVPAGYYDVAENGTSYRFGTYGFTSINEKWDLYTSLTAQFDETVYIRNQDRIEAGAVVRPVYKINSNFEIQFEAGAGYQEVSTRTLSNGNANSPNLTNYDHAVSYKFTVAPTFKFDVPQLAERPELRTFISYIGSDQEIFDTDKKYGITVGLQGEVKF